MKPQHYKCNPFPISIPKAMPSHMHCVFVGLSYLKSAKSITVMSGLLDLCFTQMVGLKNLDCQCKESLGFLKSASWRSGLAD